MKKAYNYAIKGFTGGTILFIAGCIIDTLFEKAHFSEIFTILLHNPLHYVLMSLPLILAATGYYLGGLADKEFEAVQQKLKHEADTIHEVLKFAQELNDGNLEANSYLLEHYSEIAQTLKNMRSNLRRNNKMDAKRRADDQKQNWITNGIAKFSEILREANKDTESLSYELISNLVEYLHANQGGIFLLNDDNPDEIFLEQKSCHAYDRKKFITKKILLGEGLISACFKERQTIILPMFPRII